MLIETARLLLRPFTLDDEAAYYEVVLSDPDVMRYLPSGVPLPKDRTLPILQRFMDYWTLHGFGLWAVVHKIDDRLIGHCGLQLIPDTTDVEVAYALAKPYWGIGLAPEAAQAALRFGFEHLKLDQIVAVAMPENAASQRVMVKIGMTYQKIAHVYGGELPYYTIARNEFHPGDAPYQLREGPSANHSRKS